MSNRITARRAVMGVAAAAALVVGGAPFAAAQMDTQSLDTESAAQGESGSLDSGSLGEQGGSLEKFVPDTSKKACELPGLGGSVKTLIPYFGLNIPSFVLNIATQALDEIDNPLEVAGIDVHTMGLGSLEGPVCSVLLGGTMTTIKTTTSATSTETSTSATGTSTSEEEGAGTGAPTTSSTTTTTSQVPTDSGSLDFGSLNAGS